jgi:HAMP domain-containing protein
MRIRHVGLRARLMTIVMLALAPAALLIVRNASDEHEALLRTQREDNTRLVRLVSMQQARLFEGSRHLLLALSRTDAVRSPNPAACERYLADLVARYSWYSLFGVATPSGEVVCHSRGTVPSINVADRPYFQRALHTRDFAVGEYQVGRSTGNPSFSVAYPVLSDSGRVLAVLFASVRMDQFERLGTEIGLPDHAVLITADRNATVLSHYPEAEGLAGTRLPAGALLEAASSGTSGTVEGRGIDGVERVYSYTTLSGPEGPRVFTAVGMPREEILAAARRELWLNLATVGALLLLSVAAAWFGGNTFLLRHLRHLAAAARALSEGRLHARTGIEDAPGELGEVVLAFDHMARAFEERDAARQALERANARLHALSTRLLQTQEAERQSVAYELRDVICQALAAIKMNVHVAKNRASLPQLDASLHIADETLQRVRAFSERLRPPPIVELGLEAAVRSYL